MREPTPEKWEEQAYRVPGQQLGWRVSQAKAQGLSYQVQQLGGGVYVIVIQAPVGAQPFDYQPPAPRRRSLGLPANVQVAAFVLVAAAIGFIVYAFAGGEKAIPRDADPGMAQMFAHAMNAIGGIVVLGVGLVIVWMLLPMLGSIKGMVSRAAGMVGGMIRRGQ
jgi:hypothetical protein